jgi:hypothetical protein
MTSTMASDVSALVCRIRRSELHYGATRSTRKVLPYPGEVRLERFLKDMGEIDSGVAIGRSSGSRGRWRRPAGNQESRTPSKTAH